MTCNSTSNTRDDGVKEIIISRLPATESYHELFGSITAGGSPVDLTGSSIFAEYSVDDWATILHTEDATISTNTYTIRTLIDDTFDVGANYSYRVLWKDSLGDIRDPLRQGVITPIN